MAMTPAQLEALQKANRARAAKKANGNGGAVDVDTAIIETTDTIAQGQIEIVNADGVVNIGVRIPEPVGRKYTVVWQAPSHIQIITMGESIEVTDTEVLFADGSKILIER